MVLKICSVKNFEQCSITEQQSNFPNLADQYIYFHLQNLNIYFPNRFHSPRRHLNKDEVVDLYIYFHLQNLNIYFPNRFHSP